MGIRRWYGNREYVVYFKNFGEDIKQTRILKGQSATFPGNQYYFKESIPGLTSGKFFLDILNGLCFRYKRFINFLGKNK